MMLTTERLTLTPPTEADAAFVLELLNDPGWIANIGDRGVRSLDDARTYIADRFSKSPWFVVRTGAGEAVGMCGIVVGREGLDSPDIGYAFLARHAGHGYATEAARVVLAHARDAMGLAKVAAITAPGNTASQRVLEKIGLRFVQMINLPGYEEPSAYFST
ncbi:GNAT family N-acetyltransferase [Phenylobacterium sp. J426]|uniref:GNAT family N-acetyltransferase n=1 Tax=Phenylobacterium sp. J426 TaxID=2898439 RepID=UPI002151EF49|nr:GNAT family N-acetyltransferase [Phenylobacterium sp. J426]MCR5875780.1 GNAT family N-acetyltransferase [Phenylobacterium sp. J426]